MALRLGPRLRGDGMGVMREQHGDARGTKIEETSNGPGNVMPAQASIQGRGYASGSPPSRGRHRRMRGRHAVNAGTALNPSEVTAIEARIS